MNVRLHIERLILEGLPLEAGQEPAIQAAVEAELGRLIAEQGIVPGLCKGKELAFVRGSDFFAYSSDTPMGFSKKIGGAVHGGFQS
jgi:hypothetical protein